MGCAALTTGEWKQIEHLRDDEVQWRDIANRFEVNANSLRRAWSERKHKPMGRVLTPKPAAWNERAIVIPSFEDDMSKIESAIANLRMLGRPAIIKLGSDYHFGDHDVRAIALNIEVERTLQPDMSIDNGDVADLPTLSNFALSRGVPLSSALMQIYAPYTQFVDARVEASPQTVRVSLSGNHDDRVDRKANEMWMLGDEIQQAWAALIRSNGRVLWGGWQQELDVFELNVRHGERTNMHAAKSTIDSDLAYGKSVIFGHTHRFGVWVRTQLIGGRRRVVSSYNVGYSGRNPPAYRARKSRGSDWVWACAYATVWTDDWIVDLKPVLFYETKRGGMCCVVGTTVIEVDAKGRRVG